MYECKIQTLMAVTTMTLPSSSTGVSNKEMDDVPPTTETLAKHALPLVSIQQPLELGQILASLVIG